MLFGTEVRSEYKEIDAHDPKKLFIKSVWARSEERYGEQLNNADLFIIFGCSIGKTDTWWWRRVFDKLAEGTGELIIYWYDADNKENTDSIIETFFEGCCLVEKKGMNRTKIEEAKQAAREHIFVVKYDANSTKQFLQFNF